MTQHTQDAFDTARARYYALLDNAGGVAARARYYALLDNAALDADAAAIDAARDVYYAALDDLNAAYRADAAARATADATADATARSEMANKNVYAMSNAKSSKPGE